MRWPGCGDRTDMDARRNRSAEVDDLDRRWREVVEHLGTRRQGFVDCRGHWHGWDEE